MIVPRGIFNSMTLPSLISLVISILSMGVSVIGAFNGFRTFQRNNNDHRWTVTRNDEKHTITLINDGTIKFRTVSVTLYRGEDAAETGSDQSEEPYRRNVKFHDIGYHDSVVLDFNELGLPDNYKLADTSIDVIVNARSRWGIKYRDNHRVYIDNMYS